MDGKVQGFSVEPFRPSLKRNGQRGTLHVLDSCQGWFGLQWSFDNSSIRWQGVYAHRVGVIDVMVVWVTLF